MSEQQTQNNREERARVREARKLAEQRDRDRRTWLRNRALTLGQNGR